MTAKTRLRLWVFRLIAAILVPLFLLGLLELGLRVFGFGFNTSAMISFRLNGRAAFADNYKFPWRFFPRAISRDFDPFIFPAEKPEKTYRIFIIGSSAAQGVPDGAFCFGRILGVMLRETFPGLKFEVINTALTAVNSHVALPLAQECARHQADLIIIYMGNNEVVGPYGPGTVFNPFYSSLGLIRFNMALKTLRLGQLLSGLFQPSGSGKNNSRVWRGMEMFLQSQIPAADTRLPFVYRHFRDNLEDIVRAAGGRGSRVILCTVGANLKDSPPFASQHRRDLSAGRREEWEGLYDRGIEKESSADTATALKLYLSAAEIDDAYADLHFRLGRCYWLSGDFERSRLSYLKARELDTLRFRADSEINRSLRETATGREDQGVYFMDVEKIFADESDHGLPGQELFHDHVHMNFRGNYLVAAALFNRITPWLPAGATQGDGLGLSPPSAEAAAEKLAYTDWDRYQIVDEMLNAYYLSPPFTNQLYHAEQISKLERELAGLRSRLSPAVLQESAARYEQAIAQSPQDWWLHWKYAQLLTLGQDRLREALANYEAAAKLVPHSFRGYSGMGFIQHRLHDAEGAIVSCLKALAIAPGKAEVQNTLGAAYMTKGWIDKAEARFKKAMALRPNYAAAYTNLALLYARAGRLEDSVQVCRQGLAYEPEAADLILALAQYLGQMGLREEAIAELKKAQQKDPRNEAVNKKLNELLWEKINPKSP
ncbi:MAG TPA: tetratricopeptide repeat protein [Acidobacteriota bacterium]